MKSTVSLTLQLLITCLFLEIIAQTEEGKQSEDEKEFESGEKAVAGKFPSKSTVYLVIEGGHYCGGVLITESHVLSSAQCLEPVQNEREVKVVGGSVKPENFDHAIQISEILRIVIHDAYFDDPYDDDAPVHRADIGVGLLRTRFKRSRYISTARLSTKPMKSGQEITMVGYSTYDHDTEMLYSSGTVKEYPVCYGKKKMTPMHLQISKECACVQPESKPYAFDNGFPAYQNDLVVGIVGQSISANEKTVLYIQVAKYEGFIKEAQYELGTGRRSHRALKKSTATKACTSVISVVSLGIVVGGI